MMGIVCPFPNAQAGDGSAVHLLGNRTAGFEIAHESASGNSWGSFAGPFASGQEAITAAYALNRDTYGGVCDIVICGEALQHECPDIEVPSVAGDF